MKELVGKPITTGGAGSSRIKTAGFMWMLTLIIMSLSSCSEPAALKVLVVTGGHAYDTVNFIKMFDQMEGMEIDMAIQPAVNQIYAEDSMKAYDAIVFYDMYSEINDGQKENFLNLIDQGIGLVFLHHSIGSYQDWPEYKNILGGRYDLDSSDYAHDLDLSIKISAKNHPICKGVEDFMIHDESYSNFEVLSKVTPILTTDHPESDPVLGWYHTYSASRVVYLQPGHDNNAYSHSAYQQLLSQAIMWVSSN